MAASTGFLFMNNDIDELIFLLWLKHFVLMNRFFLSKHATIKLSSKFKANHFCRLCFTRCALAVKKKKSALKVPSL